MSMRQGKESERNHRQTDRRIDRVPRFRSVRRYVLQRNNHLAHYIITTKVVPVVDTKDKRISIFVVSLGDIAAVAMIMPLRVECFVNSLSLVEHSKLCLRVVTLMQ